jgi:hypothetical protein
MLRRICLLMAQPTSRLAAQADPRDPRRRVLADAFAGLALIACNATAREEARKGRRNRSAISYTGRTCCRSCCRVTCCAGTRTKPLGEKATADTLSACGNVLSAAPVSASQRMAVRHARFDRTDLPSDEKATASIRSVWPRSVRISAPVATFQSFKL